MENWYAFTAYNTQTQYGYGTEQEASIYADHLNSKRNINHYSYEAVPAGERWNHLDSGKDTDGFALDLAIDTARENAEWRAKEFERTGNPSFQD